MNCRARLVLYSVWALLPILYACGGEHRMTFMEKIGHSQTAPAYGGEPEWFLRLKDIHTTSVQDVKDTSFFVISRIPELTHFPCKNCHEEGFTLSSPHKEAAVRRSHRDIELKHAGSDIMTCATCHNFSDIDSLRKNNGASVSFDHAYQVCRACHFQQFRDWAGGAHGKRHAYWEGPRVIRSCTGCHNPHRPAFEKRWPVTYPSIPRKYE